MEMSETVVISMCLFLWKNNLVQIRWKGDLKSRKSSVLQARNCSFVCRAFRRKVLFLVSSTKLAAVVQEIPFDHCVEGQDNIQQRSMTYVWKCKRTSSSVA